MLITIDDLLSPEQAHAAAAALHAARWPSGQATAGSLARHAKRNQQLADDEPLAQQLGQQILRALGQHPLFMSASLARRIHPPRLNRYADGGHYATHVDSAVMPMPGGALPLRSDLSATLFLSPPDSYDGGALEIETPFGAQAVKGAAGSLVLYPSSSLHRVTPVRAGQRLAAILWIESLVADDGARSLLFDLDQSIQALQAAAPALAADDPRLLQLTGTYHNLLRRWAGT